MLRSLVSGHVEAATKEGSLSNLTFPCRFFVILESNISVTIHALPSVLWAGVDPAGDLWLQRGADSIVSFCFFVFP